VLKSRARENGNLSTVLSSIVLLVQVATGVAAIDPALRLAFGRQVPSIVSAQGFIWRNRDERCDEIQNAVFTRSQALRTATSTLSPGSGSVSATGAAARLSNFWSA